MATTHSEKIKAAYAARNAAYAAQTVTVDENWQIVRIDPMNWEIQFKGAFHGYHSTILSALTALPAKMLSETTARTLGQLLESVHGIRRTIDEALKAS